MTVQFVPKKDLQGTFPECKWAWRMHNDHDDDSDTCLLTLLPTFCPRGSFSASILIALSGGMDKLVVAWDFYKGRATQLIETGKITLHVITRI